jgi:hypothetical protein
MTHPEGEEHTLTPDSTLQGTDRPPRYFSYTVFYTDDRAAAIHAPSRTAALDEARSFHPSAPPERISDGWRTYDAATGAVLAKVSGRPGKGTVGDPGPRGDRPVVPRPRNQERRPPVLPTKYLAHYDDGSTAELYAPDPGTALRKAPRARTTRTVGVALTRNGTTNKPMRPMPSIT